MTRIVLVSFALLSGCMAFAETYVATGHAQGYVCSEGATADCANAENAASGKAMQDCYAAGNSTCTVMSINDDDYGGGCNAEFSDDYCDATVIVSGN